MTILSTCPKCHAPTHDDIYNNDMLINQTDQIVELRSALASLVDFMLIRRYPVDENHPLIVRARVAQSYTGDAGKEHE